MNCVRQLFLYIVLLTSIASSSLLLPGPVGNGTVLVTLTFILLLYIYTTDTITVQKFAIRYMFIIYILMMINMVRFSSSSSVLTGQFVRVPAVILASFVCLFLIPTLYDFDTTASIINRLAAVIILIGIPSLLLGSHKFLWITIDPYTTFAIIPGSEISLPALRSIYPDTNAAAKIAMFTLFLSLYEVRKERSLISYTLLSIALAGVYFTFSRGVILAAVCGFVIYILSMYTSRQLTLVSVVGLFVSIPVGFLFLVGVFPTPLTLENINLSLRGVAWRAAIQAFVEHPLLGLGFGESSNLIAPYVQQDIGISSQNSYLKLFVSTGLIGGIAYLLFTVKSITTGVVREPKETVPVELLSLCVALATVQVFENFSLFGVNQSSIIASIMFGYLVKMATDKKT